jgi:PAS domain S-box-containing protein
MRALANTLLARLLIGSAIPLVLFLGVGLVSGVVISGLLSGLRLEKHSHEVLSDALRLNQHLDAMRFAAESARPGTLERLPRYRVARDELLRIGKKLRGEVADSPEREKAAAAILGDTNRLVEVLKRPDSGREANLLFTALEQRIGAFLAHEQDLLARRRAETEERNRQSVPVIGGAVALALVLTVLLSLGAARSVTRPVAQLREAAGLLMAGRYRSVPPEGPTEIADLIVLFNHMALTLSERTSVLAQQEERYRTYVGAVAHILWATDAEGAVRSDLPTWRAFTGQSEEAVLGLGWLDAVHPDERESVRAAWLSAVAQRSIYEVECRLCGSSGDYRWFNCRGVPIINGDGSVREWIGTCADITEAKQRAALEQQRDAAEASSRAKSEFLTRMSHELRTPLNAVIGMSKMLATQRFGPLNSKQADYLADITGAGEHLLALINDILDLSKVESGKMEVQPDSFAVAAAVHNLASTLRPLAESRGVTLHLPQAEDGALQTDPARFRQVLYNLLSNAIKFTPAGGKVTVSWEWIGAPVLAAPAVPEAAAEAIRIAVSDTGVGIAPEDQEAIWEEFRQLRPATPEGQQGTGLGLALTRRLVALLGGAIGLVSAPGKGSTFTVVLPRRLEGTEEVEEKGEADQDRPVALVIEDHGPTNKLLCDWLADAGMKAVSTLDGQTGLTRARDLHPALIVLDIHLPILDGWQVLTELKGDAETAGIPVVIVTVNGERQPASGFAVQEFFVKPIDRDAFLRRLRELQPHLFGDGRKPRVLVVDDDPAARKLLGQMLRADGVEVLEAADGREALARLCAQTVDLVVLDLMMPRMDGFRVVEEVRSRPDLTGLPILVVTARDLAGEERRRLQGHIQALLEKHRLTPERLREHLQGLGLAGGK